VHTVMQETRAIYLREDNVHLYVMTSSTEYVQSRLANSTFLKLDRGILCDDVFDLFGHALFTVSINHRSKYTNDQVIL